MATGPQAFYCLWQDSHIRDKLFDLLSNEDLCALRVANSACCNLVTKRLFLRTHITFSANTFTNPGRIQALSRIGHHIEHLTFHFGHSDATFLPPLVNPESGKEICFLYSPHTSMASVLARPKYANTELGEILTQQYPPLFHAASNVPSFMNALQHMANMRHLTIKTPGQDPKERYRRDIVDYALISLRISLERAPLTKLTKLSLSGVHPAAFNYLRHAPGGFGASPGASRRWRQIRKLHISVEAWDFYGPSPGLDHLKIMDDYIRNFTPQLEKFAFTWLGGRKGPCPIALSGDPLFAPPRNTKKLFNEVTSPMSPLPARPARHPLVMPALRYMTVKNVTMNAPQLRELVASYKGSVREFEFQDVVLVDGGNLEEALAPLSEQGEGGRDVWRHSNVSAENAWRRRPATARSGSGSAVTSSEGDELLPEGASAAATAASRELFAVDLEGMVFGGQNDVDVEALEVGVEQWARGVTAAAAAAASSTSSGSGRSPSFETIPEDVGGLASDIDARPASVAFSTKLKKRRIRKKKSSRAGDEDDDRKSEQRSEHHSRSRQHKHSRSDDTSHRRDRSQSRHRRHHHHHRRHHSEEQLPEMPPMPEVIGTDDEAFNQRPRTPETQQPKLKVSLPKLTTTTPPPTRPLLTRSPRFSPSRSSPRNSETRDEEEREMSITPPIHSPSPFPVLLQPTVYDPSATAGPFVNNNNNNETDNANSSNNNATSSPNRSRSGSDHRSQPRKDGLSTVQRHIEADLLAEAQESAARSSALKRAKEAVLAKLSREFSPPSASSPTHRRKVSNGHGKDSAAALASAGLASALNLNIGGSQHPTLLTNQGNGWTSTNNMATMNSFGARLREGLFGRSMANVSATAGHNNGYGGSYGGGHHGNNYCSSVVSDHMQAGRTTSVATDARSVMVPLIISRS
ncbi:hypothetical protein B0H66DRAFT_113279 [Apodospora peruviana]|uniref:Uncharacterized protein n=1 Tax=Apodospora peruviana TaxID=516989 RepID=A0AAE0MB48_9PEZI|nr:hypothetical protein B0H66DRAFT_113279 [Apodospora peruviana]